MIRTVFALIAVVLLSGFGEPDRYAAGQVWEYRTRPTDTGSLLKIQQAENHPDFEGPVYHISIIGLRFRDTGIDPVVPHTPVSRRTLDASATRLSSETPDFPDPREGIAIWRSDKGGVFTISVAEIVEFVDQQVSRQ